MNSDFYEGLKTVEDVFKENGRVRNELVGLVSRLSHEEADTRTEDGKWTVAGIVEHLANSTEGMAKISIRLMRKAAERGVESDGTFELSDGFAERVETIDDEKFEAPSMVQPSGSAPIDDSLFRLAESSRFLLSMKEDFLRTGGNEFTFPHPIFGPMTAHDWLALIGGHEARHLQQIKRTLGIDQG